MASIESKENRDLIVNFYLDRLFRLECMRSMNKVKTIGGEVESVLIGRCLTSNLMMLIDLGYREQAIEMLNLGRRIQIGDESQFIKHK